jgi:hypothetical protein
MTQHLPADQPSGSSSTGVVVDPVNCTATAFSYANWQVAGAPYCDLRDVQVFFNSGTAPTLYTRCDGHDPASSEAFHLSCGAKAEPTQ